MERNPGRQGGALEPIPILLMARELGLGGSERQLTEIAKALDRGHFQPHVGCFYARGLRAVELRAAGVPIVEIPVRSFYAPASLLAARQMGRYIERHRIQLVHTFDVPLNLFGVPVARAFRAPLVLSSQRASRKLTPGLARHLLRLTDLIADAVVVNCEAMRRHLIEEEHVPPARIQLCYNGLDTREFQPIESRSRSPLTVGVVCALRPEKSLETLLEAFSRVRSPGRARLVIVGDGPSLSFLESHARALQLGPDCRFEPATNQVADRLREIDIFVLPSKSEALSNSLMEAMACGCAAVASNVGGNPELVEDGRTGLLFESGSVEQLAAVLRLLVENEPLRLKLARAGSRFISKNFSLEAAARNMGRIYAELLKPGIEPSLTSKGAEFPKQCD